MLIDTGRYDLAPYRARVAEFADTFDLAVEEVPGTTRILDALVDGGWGADFVVAPPGHEFTLQDFRPELFAGDGELRQGPSTARRSRHAVRPQCWLSARPRLSPTSRWQILTPSMAFELQESAPA